MSSPAPRSGPTLSRAVRRHRRSTGAAVLRTEGVRRLLARTGVWASGLVYRSVVILARDLSEPLPEVASALPVEMRLLEEGDFEALQAHRADLEPAYLTARLGRLGHGHACVGAWLEGEIVATVWIAFDEARVPEIDRRLLLGPGRVFLYDSYTSEAARGNGVATVRAVWTMKHLRDAGYRYAIGHIAPENRPAHGPAVRAGYRALGSAGYFRLGPFRRNFVCPVGHGRRWTSGGPIDVAGDFLLDD